MQIGETAWRITKGKFKGRLCWTTDDKIDLAIRDKTKLTVQLVIENVAYYGTWGGEQVEVNPRALTKVYLVAKWSDEV